MQIKSNSKFLYLFYLIIFFNNFIFDIKPVSANIYKVQGIEIIEPYNLEFSKENVIEKAFINSFSNLMAMIIDSNDLDAINTNDINLIRPMIETFSITNEKFSENNYTASFDIIFDKKKIFDFLNKKEIISSLPIKKNIFFLPVFINLENNEHYMFNQDKFYIDWNSNIKDYELLNYFLPNEDIEEYNIINSKISKIEDYKFEEIIERYELKDYIICIFFYNNKNLNVLTRLKLNNDLLILKSNFNYINIKNENFHLQIIDDLKLVYENTWKKVNKINTNINLNIYISVDTKNYKLANRFEKELNNSYMIPEYKIDKITNRIMIYKIIYNNTPDKFITNFTNKNFELDTTSKIWKLKNE